MGWIARAWRGEERLWKVFWIYGVLLGILFAVVASVIHAILGWIAYFLFWIVRAVYMVWVTVAQWRCAFNAEWTIWSYVVRILIILSIVTIALGLLFGGAGIFMVGHDLIGAAECRKELKEYVAQGGKDIEGFRQQCLERETHSKSVFPQSKASGIMDAVKAGYKCAEETNAYQKKGGKDVQAFEHDCIERHLHKNPAAGQPSVNPSPLKSPDGARESPEDKYKRACESKMVNYARQSGADPQQYITQNQAYVQQCIQYYAHQNQGTLK